MISSEQTECRASASKDRIPATTYAGVICLRHSHLYLGFTSAGEVSSALLIQVGFWYLKAAVVPGDVQVIQRGFNLTYKYPSILRAKNRFLDVHAS